MRVLFDRVLAKQPLGSAILKSVETYPHPNLLPHREKGWCTPSPCQGEDWGEGQFQVAR